jgi:hypothetical protein
MFSKFKFYLKNPFKYQRDNINLLIACHKLFTENYFLNNLSQFDFKNEKTKNLNRFQDFFYSNLFKRVNLLLTLVQSEN